ncbi:MAG: polyprenyl diphosphate synthase, partial [bacterium]|nr:polyprenyl diphosphate synthase [bacterium]
MADIDTQVALKASGKLPGHIAIIMDGNGRWAQNRDLRRSDGHRSARETVRDIVRVCGELQIDILTLFTFGTDNWRRPWSEILSLMQLLRDSSREELEELQENNVRLVTTGDINRLVKQSRLALEETIRETAGNTGLTLN